MYKSTSPKYIPIQERTFNFSVSIVLFVKILPKDIAGNAIGNQLIRSGTSIGANVEESQNAPSRKDFIRGMTIALKEARETEYWLKIIEKIKLVGHNASEPLLKEINEIIKILTAIIKKSKENS